MPTTPESADLQDARLRASIDRSLRHPVMFFFTSGAMWLAVAIILGFVSSAKTHAPTFLDGCSWMSYGRVYAAHINTLVYGWGCQAAFGLVIWLMARLSRKECHGAVAVLVAGHIWNIAVTVGVLGILFGHGTGVPWMEFPTAVWPVLLASYLFIAVWSFIHFRCREGGHVYISQWYVLAALFWFPWIFLTSHLFVHVFDTNPVLAAGVNAWFKGSFMFLFFVPVAVATAYYLAPKVTGRPVYSYSLAILGFWALAVIGPWTGMQKLAGSPLPQFMPYVGAAATVLFLIPAITVGVNILLTIRGHDEVVQASPSLRFTVAGIIGLVILGAVGLILNIGPSIRYIQFSMTGYGYEVLALYGVFSMCAFGGIYFIVPRVTRREWLSRRLIKWHYYLSVYGTLTIVGASILGGFLQGQAQEFWDMPWMDAATRGYAYGIGTTVAWAFILFANVFFFLHLLLMWARLGRRSQHPTLLRADAHGGSPHGPEGDLDELEAANA